MSIGASSGASTVTQRPRSRPYPAGVTHGRRSASSNESGSFTVKRAPASGWRPLMKRNTFFPTFATDSSQG
jgi:hypothetical protein